MRAIVLTIAVLGACTPDIVAGAYLCGPNESCPESQVCNGVDNTCVLPGGAEPFACGTVNEVEPNNGAAAAQLIANVPCVSTLIQVKGCAPADDAEDWFGFDVPSGCSATAATVQVSFPLAFEQLSLELAGGQGTATGSSAMCDGSSLPDDGADQVCLKQAVTAGGHYTVRVAHSGVGNCAGACAFNRYTLTLQLGTP